MGLTDTKVERFKRFMAAARPLLATVEHSSTASRRGAPPTASFRAFVERATPVATAHARALIRRLTPVGRTLRPWLVPHDLLEVAGYAYVETAYTSLLSWALFPPGRPDAALACQRAWASRVASGLVVHRAAEPYHQLWTEDGIPDLVLVYDDGVLVVEAKTKSAEHGAPSGAPQTVAYALAAPGALGVEHAHKTCHLVYLTTDRSKPAYPQAVASTYAELAFALAAAGQTLAADDPLRPAYAMLITHFVRCAVPRGANVEETMDQLEVWSCSPGAVSGSEIIMQLASIQTIAALLLPEEDT